MPNSNPGVIARLFDLSFSRFVALSLVRMFYLLMLILGLLVMCAVIAGEFGLFNNPTVVEQLKGIDLPPEVRQQIDKTQGGPDMIVVISAPFAFLAYLVVVRIICETVTVLFAMAEDMEQIRQGIDKLAKK